ncbi:MAG: Uncharacterized protein CEN88_254 [Candidatus Berkelbacteria bacterium Licking1014_2]|uniref:Uncharacterized protein n=1 Tax=Candidatus Berkelbacteria bacterium Licking1014_2 TaxID=2017146 RepID=A0A554LVN2_9BACT|nr:MAG: Uncharacterized protein CEN88_254 [Candidatus Berkelbacteria bacterium Licking1014_2]
MGNLNPPGHTFPTDHIYFYLANNIQPPLYSPGDLTITEIGVGGNLTQGISDYSITLQNCSEFEVYFLHVTSISTKLSDEFTSPFEWDNTYTTGGNTYRNYGKSVNISVSGGEQIGTVGGNPGQSSFDMGAYDTRVTLNFANSGRWTIYNTIHTVCPIDYYSETLKSTLTAMFGDYDGSPKRTVEPVCGTVEQDVANTAQGAWFLKGTDNSWSGEDTHLALVHHNVNPNTPVFSVGNSLSASNLPKGVYEFSAQGSGLINRDFDDVTSDNNIYCYQMDGQGWVEGSITILVQLSTSTILKIERGADSACGSGPWSFTGSVSEFER